MVLNSVLVFLLNMLCLMHPLVLLPKTTIKRTFNSPIWDRFLLDTSRLDDLRNGHFLAASRQTRPHTHREMQNYHTIRNAETVGICAYSSHPLWALCTRYDHYNT